MNLLTGTLNCACSYIPHVRIRLAERRLLWINAEKTAAAAADRDLTTRAETRTRPGNANSRFTRISEVNQISEVTEPKFLALLLNNSFDVEAALHTSKQFRGSLSATQEPDMLSTTGAGVKHV